MPNVAASVQQRLLNLSRDRGEDFQFVLVRYAAERFLFRLAHSVHSELLVLKGAGLFFAWTEQVHRPTRDLDFLGLGKNTPDAIEKIVLEVLETDVGDDGLEFDGFDIQVTGIRETGGHAGQRMKISTRLGSAVIPLRLDIGFGDSVVPGIETVEYPSLLDPPGFELRGYPRESVVAEKLQAIAALGMANSRLKDYYDLLVLARNLEFDGTNLRDAIRATFACRQTPILPQVPMGLSGLYSDEKSNQWQAFETRTGLDTGLSLQEVVPLLREFLLAPMEAARVEEEFPGVWTPGGPWTG